MRKLATAWWTAQAVAVDDLECFCLDLSQRVLCAHHRQPPPLTGTTYATIVTTRTLYA